MARRSNGNGTGNGNDWELNVLRKIETQLHPTNDRIDKVIESTGGHGRELAERVMQIEGRLDRARL